MHTTIRELARRHVKRSTHNPNDAAIAIVQTLIGLGRHRTQFHEAKRTLAESQSLTVNWTYEQLEYIEHRAQRYGQTITWILNQFPRDILQDPSAVIDALDQAGRLPGMQIEHILSQSQAPELADVATNMLLAPSDGFNQSLQDRSMSIDTIKERIQARNEYLDTIRSEYGINQSIEVDLTFGFQDSWDAFHQLTEGPLRAIYCFKFVNKETWKKTIRLGQRIVQHMPHVRDSSTRKQMLNEITQHIHFCAGRADCHVAFLMFLLITNVPWAATLLAAQGLATLAQLVINQADCLINFIEQRAGAVWIAKLLRSIGRPIKLVVNIFSGIIRAAWSAVESAIFITGDIMSTVYNASQRIISSVWNGLCGLFDFFQHPHSATSFA